MNAAASIGYKARALALVAGVVLGAGLAANLAAAAEWKPEKPVEIIAVNAPGGGSDRIARILVKVLQERRYVQTPIAVVNKPGGGGTVAYAYISQRPADGHYLVLSSRSILTNHITGVGPSYTEFTPVVNLFGEYISVTVRPDSPLRSGRDLIERVRKDPAALSFGIATSLGNPNHQGAAAALKAAGLDIRKMKNVIFQSGGAATSAMLGGHIDVVPISAAYAASLVRNGQVRPIAVTSPARLSGVLAEVPTWREQGYDAVVSTWRCLIGPKGMSEAQIAYWEAVIRRAVESDVWKSELETNFWTSEFMGSAATRNNMDRDNEQVRAFLADLGMAR